MTFRQCESVLLDRSMVEQSETIEVEMDGGGYLNSRILLGSTLAVIESENNNCVWPCILDLSLIIQCCGDYAAVL